MQTIWYLLIHISLGLIGWKLFTITNLGIVAAFSACAAVQAWPMYEIFRLTWEKFQIIRDEQKSKEKRKKETRAYWIRMGRLYIFRTSSYTFLTLFVAWLMRG